MVRAYKKPIFLRAKNLLTPLPTRKSTLDRRHDYTTLTNASTSLPRQDEHTRTQSLPGLLILTPTHSTGWSRPGSLEPNWLSCAITREDSAARQLWPARDTLVCFSDRAWRAGVPCAQRVVRVVQKGVIH